MGARAESCRHGSEDCFARAVIRLHADVGDAAADQIRAKEFCKDFTTLLAEGRAPAMTLIRLSNDHTGTPQPGDEAG